MASEGDVLKGVLETVAAQFPDTAGALDAHSDLYALGLDSTAAIELMTALETRFDIVFPESLFDESTFASPHALQQAVLGLLR